MWPDRNAGCTPLAARVLPTAASSQGNCLRLSSFWLSLGLALDLGRVVSFAPSLGTSFVSKRLFNTARSIYCLSRLKPDKRFVRNVLKVALWSELIKSEADIQSPIVTSLFRFSLLS